jgi:phosphotransacetylase
MSLVQKIVAKLAELKCDTGLSRPAGAVSRGASAHDIFGAAAIVGWQAIDQRLLYTTP